MKTSALRAIVTARWAKWMVGLLLLATAVLTYPQWWPALNGWIDGTIASRAGAPPKAGGGETHGTPADNHVHSGDHAHDGHGHEHGHDHEEDEHDHAGHSEGNALELTPQSLKNLGLTSEYLRPIELANFYRTITVPAIVVAKPGRTEIQVSSPMIGIVQHVHATSGEAVVPGGLLFEVRLTYEDLVETQTQLLKNVADLAIEQREIARLEEVTRSGAVASKFLLERQYALQKLESSIAAQRAALQLHGLSEEQVDTIVREQKLLRDLTIVAPEVDSHAHEEDDLRLSDRRFSAASYHPGSQAEAASGEPTPLIVERLNASKGQGVQAGEMLCTLADYSALYIEGKAFEQDAPAIAEVVARGWPIAAVFPGVAGPESVGDLKLAYVANAVDAQSRTLSFYVDLPNTKLRDETSPEGQRFVTWRYRVGQRLELRVPVESWEQQIVLPVDAAVKDGAEWYVFQQNGDHFDRVAVHVKYRDQQNVVIENDGAISPGDVVALRSAHQMQMAIKNKSGAGVDPHAGHNH